MQYLYTRVCIWTGLRDVPACSEHKYKMILPLQAPDYPTKATIYVLTVMEYHTKLLVKVWSMTYDADSCKPWCSCTMLKTGERTLQHVHRNDCNLQVNVFFCVINRGSFEIIQSQETFELPSWLHLTSNILFSLCQLVYKSTDNCKVNVCVHGVAKENGVNNLGPENSKPHAHFGIRYGSS